jgi:hypothetical protein
MNGMSRNRRVTIVADIRHAAVRLMIAFARSELRAAVWCLHPGLIGRLATHRAIRMATRLNGAALRLMHGHFADLR